MKYLLLLLLISSCSTRITPALEENQTKAKEECQTFKKTIPVDWIQGHISVPENPQMPDGPKINVFYYGKLIQGKTNVG